MFGGFDFTLQDYEGGFEDILNNDDNFTQLQSVEEEDQVVKDAAEALQDIQLGILVGSIMTGGYETDDPNEVIPDEKVGGLLQYAKNKV